MLGSGKRIAISVPGSTREPTALNSPPIARFAATGEKMSRPWNVELVRSSIHARFSRTRASRIPPRRSAPATSRPLSGPIRTSPRLVSSPIGLRAVPTPGSTTATWTPTGIHGSASDSRKAPSRTAYFRTEWLMSTICASRAIDSITPRQIAAAESGPKSVRKLMNGRGGEPVGCIGPRWYPSGPGNRDGAQRRPGAVSVVRAEGRSPQLAGRFQVRGGSMTCVEPERARRRRWLAGRRARVGARGAIAVAADSARTSAAYAIRCWMMASTSGSDQRKPALGKPCRNAVRFAASPASRPRASRARYVALRLAATGRSCDSGWSSIDPAFRASQTVRPADPVGSVRGSSGRIGRVAMTHQYQARRYFLRARL